MKNLLAILVCVLALSACQSVKRVEICNTEQVHRQLCAMTLPNGKDRCWAMPYAQVQHLIQGYAVDKYLAATKLAGRCE